MARDYKHAEVFSSGTKPMPLWIWFFAAVAISGFVGLIYYLDQYERAKSVAHTVESPKAPTVTQQESKSETSDETESRFDFYKLLPKLSVDVPKSGSTDRQSDGAAQKEKDSQPAFSYILQAGSFKEYQQADRLKASLALMGIQANIEKVTLNQSEVWHRVRIGPIASEREMNKIRNKLRSENIEPVALKVKS